MYDVVATISFPVENNATILHVAKLSVGLREERYAELRNWEIDVDWLLFSLSECFLDLLTLFLTVADEDDPLLLEYFCSYVYSLPASSVSALEYLGWLPKFDVAMECRQLVVVYVNFESGILVWINQGIF